MARSGGEVVLVTGVHGFMGQHLLKLLQRDKSVTEIRGLDKLPFNVNPNLEKEYLDGVKPLKIYQKNLLDVESCREVVRGVDVVFHCSGSVSYGYPPPKAALRENNVLTTENVVQLCLEEDVSRLIYCSTTDVSLQSCFKGGIVAIVIYRSESKMENPTSTDRLIFGEYAATKLLAETLVLKANGTPLASGTGVLHTVSLRPTLLYGEGDTKLIAKLLTLAKQRGCSLPRLAGSGGKHQATYVGNAAWAFICAKNTLRINPESIAGLPVNITDDTPICDILRFCQKITKPSKNSICISSWSIPMIISYVFAWIIEIVTFFNFGFLKKLSISPRSMIAYLGSVILYDRARASIHLNYVPIYSAQEAMDRASSYYCRLFDG